jgi:hypothetical protein
MNFDPTTNRIPYGLLPIDEQEELKAWPHGVECYCVGGYWGSCTDPAWCSHIVYRGKPAPVVTSWWLNVYGGGVSFRYESRSEANCYALRNRIDVLRIDTCNGVSTAHLEGLKDE